MRAMLSALVLLSASIANAQQDGKRMYQKDSLGNNLHHNQSWVVKNGKMCPVDVLGNREHHKPCFDIGSKDMENALNGGKIRK